MLAVIIKNKNAIMKIIIKQQFKSITTPCEFELPGFSVLTGKNGSGKTHLLTALSNNSISEVSINGRVLKKIRIIGFNGLNPNIHESCDPKSITTYVKDVWNKYNTARQQVGNSTSSNIETILVRVSEEKHKQFIRKTIAATQKPYDQLTEDDLSDNFDIAYMGQNDFFTGQFALIFKNYHRRQEENNINEYYQSKSKPISKPVLSEQEFIAKYGTPPWDFINNILLETNIPYEVNSPEGTRFDSTFIFKLKDRVAGFEISSADLSTGEKVLMSLALAIYNSGENNEKPELLLIDEPDAGLHPAMSKMMVNVLKRNIVEQNNIPTIITTHSPTTVIASEGISIYQVERDNNIPVKISTQKAVEILSCDIPFLKISTERRRQVFVESKYDVIYYELISNIISRLENLNSDPIFIPARTSNGSNCTDVIEVVTNLSQNGNDQIYGIIDWDTSNSSNGRVIVLGENERYAIENYLLDPLLMGLLFIRERKKDITHFGQLSISTYSQANQLTIEDSQLIINKVLSELQIPMDNVVKYKTYNGWELDISSDFNLYQGHNLEALYKSIYPFLNSHQREDSLKKEVIEKVINDYPQFTPQRIIETIMKIK